MKNKKLIQFITIPCFLIFVMMSSITAQDKDAMVTDEFLKPAKENATCEERLKALKDSCDAKIKKLTAVKPVSNTGADKKEINDLKEEIKKLNVQKDRLQNEKSSLLREKEQRDLEIENLKKKYSSETKTIKEHHNSKQYKNENIRFHTKSFEVFVVNDPSDLKFYLRDKKTNLSSLSDLRNKVEKGGKELLFGTNGGMYNMERQPQGHLIINSKAIKSLDKSNPKDGTNFYLKPNGVFFIDAEGKGAVLETDAYAKKKIKPKYATQSGPMLVVDGKIHPVLNPFGTSKKIRSGVGVKNDGTIIFAISNEPVNFHTFARLFKHHYQCDNALFLDGTVSRMYTKHGKKQLGGNFGPMIGIAQEREVKKTADENGNAGEKK